MDGIKRWKAMASLVERAWFKRRWVIQEIAFAASVLVHCGDRVFVWSELSAAISFLQKHGYDIWQIWQTRVDHKRPELAVHRGFGDLTAKAAARLIIASQDVIKRDSETGVLSWLHNLDKLIWLFSDFQVSDQRDVIYALIPLARDVHNYPQWLPDYSQNFQETAIQYMTYVMRTSNSIDAICRPWVPASSLSSWILALSRQYSPAGGMIRPGRKHSNMLVGAPGETQYRASGRSKPDWKQTGYFLTVKGFEIDVIKTIGSTDTKENVPSDWRGMISDQVWKAYRQPDDGYFFPAEVCETLTAKSYSGSGFSHAAWRQACDRYLAPKSNISALETPTTGDEEMRMESFLLRVKQCTRFRKLAITNTGRLSLVKSKARPNDLVVILFGCSVPVVLRKDGQHLVLLGKAYIHGVMDGQALQGLERGSYASHDFVLK